MGTIHPLNSCFQIQAASKSSFQEWQRGAGFSVRDSSFALAGNKSNDCVSGKWANAWGFRPRRLFVVRRTQQSRIKVSWIAGKIKDSRGQSRNQRIKIQIRTRDPYFSQLNDTKRRLALCVTTCFKKAQSLRWREVRACPSK